MIRWLKSLYWPDVISWAAVIFFALAFAGIILGLVLRTTDWESKYTIHAWQDGAELTLPSGSYCNCSLGGWSAESVTVLCKSDPMGSVDYMAQVDICQAVLK